MSWIREVGHVVAKDIREFRWSLMVFVALAAAAAARSAGLTSFSVVALGISVIVVMLAGMIIIASVVQADSPTRAHAFWARHPFRPSAMIGAKIGFLLLLVAIGLVAQAIGIWSYGVPGSRFAGLLAAAVPPTLCWMIAAMAIAAITRDLRSFLLAVIGVPLLGYLSALAFWQILRTPAPNPDSFSRLTVLGLTWLAVIAAAGFLMWLYESREMRLRTRVIGTVVAAFAIFAAVLPGPRDPEEATEPAGDVPLLLEMPQEGNIGRGQIRLDVVGSPSLSEMSLTFEPHGYSLRIRDGSTVHFNRTRILAASTGMGFSNTMATAVPDVRWMNLPAPSPMRTTLFIELTPVERAAVAGGIASAVLEGRAVVSEPHRLATMPLRVGAEAVNGGYRMRIEEWTPGLPELPLSILISRITASVMGPVATGSLEERDMVVALINRSRNEAFMLFQRGGEASLDGLVLPGVPVRTGVLRFERFSPDPSSVSMPDAAWLQGAELMVLTRIPRGSHHVRLERATP